MSTIYLRKSTWWIQYYIEGRRTIKSLHTQNERHALQMQKELDAKIQLRLLAPESTKVLLEDAIDTFISYKKSSLKPSSATRYGQFSSNLKTFFNARGRTYLGDLKNSDIAAFVEQRKKDGASGKTITDELLILKATIGFLIKERRLRVSPIQQWPKIAKTTEKPETINRYSPVEIAQIKAFFKTHVDLDYFIGLIYTGCRRSELWAISRADVDLESNTIRIQNLKTGTTPGNQFRTVEIHPELRLVLEKRMEGKKPQEKLFPIKGSGIWLIHALRKACMKLGIPYRRLHGLRHSFISALLNAGVPPRLVMAMAGHTNLSTTLRYSHINQDDLKGRIGQLGY